MSRKIQSCSDWFSHVVNEELLSQLKSLRLVRVAVKEIMCVAFVVSHGVNFASQW
ncbi:hypothetical protein B0I35DRAFT_445524 [Stachybotrys elegans]|uniref:Uncharacterized protein n=1 Tax=Stachybotrys elegans TaxID=80388 RepID=A0A8K0SIR7_9HYPO|nr:hypothetical protein B0I35DRAFT_445524 [Stachybotrys elegans]